MSHPEIFGLFQKRIAGDDALFALARHRFREAGLAPEFYVNDAAERRALESFHPCPERPAILHLPRGLDLLHPDTREFVVSMAAERAESVRGMVVHDQGAIRTDFDRYLDAVREIDRRLRSLPATPYLFLEYAVGLEPDLFCRTVEAAGDCSAVSACIDIGHIGIYRAREAYAEQHPERTLETVTAVSPEIVLQLPDLDSAVRCALPAVRAVIRRLARLGKPLHFHLHDGHPLVANQYGVPDHKSFLDKPSLPGPDGSPVVLETLYGPEGLRSVIQTASTDSGLPPPSFTLEIHETLERLPLDAEAECHFRHWRDRTNAEKMNHWLDLLARNAALVTKTYGADPPSWRTGDLNPKSTIQNPKSTIPDHP